ncbi:hypothetical protein D3C77_559630 [compost metagenome]
MNSARCSGMSGSKGASNSTADWVSRDWVIDTDVQKRNRVPPTVSATSLASLATRFAAASTK